MGQLKGTSSRRVSRKLRKSWSKEFRLFTFLRKALGMILVTTRSPRSNFKTLILKTPSQATQTNSRPKQSAIINLARKIKLREFRSETDTIPIKSRRLVYPYHRASYFNRIPYLPEPPAPSALCSKINQIIDDFKDIIIKISTIKTNE